MFDAGGIASVLKLDVDPYAQGMLRAGSIAQAFPATVTTFLTNPILGFGEVLADLGHKFVSFFNEAAEHGDAMGDLADSVGIGVESLTALGAVAQLAGSSTQGVADGYRFLGRSVADAMANIDSGASKTFRKLGVDLMTAGGTARPLEDVMLSLADAIQKLPAGGERTAVAMDLLGRSGTELIPTLIQGRQAIAAQMDQMKAYGVTVSESSHKSADAWNDGMAEMAMAWTGLGNAIAVPIRDALTPKLKELVAWTENNQPKIRAEIEYTTDVILARWADWRPRSIYPASTGGRWGRSSRA